MSTTSVQDYESLMDTEIIRIARSDQWCSIKNRFDRFESNAIFGELNHLTEKDMVLHMKYHKKLQDLFPVYLIYACFKLTSYYITETQLTISKYRRHIEQIEELHKLTFNAQVNLNKDPARRHYLKSNHIKKLINLLEQGVLTKQCNLRGNFANICRAIVSRSEGCLFWSFNPLFLSTLGYINTLQRPQAPREWPNFLTDAPARRSAIEPQEETKRAGSLTR